MGGTAGDGERANGISTAYDPPHPPTPSPRSTDADALAFAVHAFMLAQDYKLTAAGAAADGEDPLDAGAPEVGPDGWDGLDGVYA